MYLPIKTTSTMVEPVAILSIVLGNIGLIFDAMASILLTAKSPAVHSLSDTPPW